MNTTTTTQNPTAKRYEDLNDFEKSFIDGYRKLPPEDQREVSAAIMAAVKITYATPEQIAALCGRLGITDNPSRYICSLSAAYDLIENNGQPVKAPKERRRQLLALLEMTMRNLARITRDTRKMERIILEQAQLEQQYQQRQAGRR